MVIKWCKNAVFRTVIIILVCVMLFSCIPTTVFSAEDYIDPELCEHEYTVHVEELFPNPYCVSPKKYVCELCGDEYTVEGVRRGECIWIVIVEPAFDSDGVEMLFCTKCKGGRAVFPVRHEFVPPTLFADVDYNAWYGYAVEYYYITVAKILQ